MASSASSFFPRWKHDVFLSFRGEDTRNNFVGHLHFALTQRGIDAFIDNNLHRGERISTALVEAIERSRIAIVVFSRNFVSSTWCLDELLKVLECRESKGQLVHPVFLHVDPSEMRKETGIFACSLAKHEENFKDEPEKVQRWRLALREAASLSGWHLDDGVESELITKIVEEVSSKLSRPYFHVAKHPVALELHVQTIYSMLLKDVGVVGICGIGGIGKTTIAKAVYNLIADQFEGSSFLANVREISRRYGLVKLQEALLCDMLGNAAVKVGYTLTGVKLIREKLHDKTVLLVLDDVDSLTILTDLLGEGEWFGSGSRIIVTSRQEESLIGHGIEVHKIHEINYEDALQLFCWNAFQKPSPPRDYKLLSFSFTTYVKGIPLLLIVLGSYLKGKSIEEWHRSLNRLQEVHESKGDEILRICFDSLETHERTIFLDIACFFHGEDKDYVIKQLDRCNFYPESGLAILEEKSLISIESNKIWMHDFVREMGRKIVHEESPTDPGRRSRLWHREDVLQVLTGNSGIISVEGIKLDMVDPEELLMIMKAMKKMKRLRLFIAKDIHISGCPEYLRNELSWLDVHENDLPDDADASGVKELDHHGKFFNQVRTHSLNFKRIKVALKKAFSSWRIRWRMHGGSGDGDLTDVGILLENELIRFRRFSLKELRQATNNFSADNIIGVGGYSSVYCGILHDGVKVAIKRIRVAHRYEDCIPAFITECRVVSWNNHKNVVKVIGFLAEKNELALVYEYLSNRSLSHHLHGTYDSPLTSWTGRLKVALDAARGIEYLHDYLVPSIIHRDVKSSNILLDVDFTAKVSDYGMAALIGKDDAVEDTVRGTPGYLDPEYLLTGRFSRKSDVYGFGVVLLELLSGGRAIHHDEYGVLCDLTTWAGKYIMEGDICKVLDPNVQSPNPEEMEALREVAFLAVDCTGLEVKDRPSMAEVVHRIYGAMTRCVTVPK